MGASRHRLGWGESGDGWGVCVSVGAITSNPFKKTEERGGEAGWLIAEQRPFFNRSVQEGVCALNDFCFSAPARGEGTEADVGWVSARALRGERMDNNGGEETDDAEKERVIDQNLKPIYFCLAGSPAGGEGEKSETGKQARKEQQPKSPRDI